MRKFVVFNTVFAFNRYYFLLCVQMRRSMEQVRLEVSVVNDRVMAAQEDNQAFFRSFSDSIDQTRRILEAQQVHYSSIVERTAVHDRQRFRKTPIL